MWTGCHEKKSNLFIDQYAEKHYNAIPVKVDDPQRIRRDVREAEGARLEIVCAVNSGTEGSNPSLSAIETFGCILQAVNR